MATQKKTTRRRSGLVQKFTGEYAKRRQQIFDDLLKEYPDYNTDLVFMMMLQVFAEIKEQCERLQDFIDTEGWTYVKYDKSGVESVVRHPAGDVLTRMQQGVLREGNRLLKYTPNDDDSDDNTDLLA